MKLYMKEQLFSMTDRFTIKNDLGNDIYHVQTELFTWGKKMHIYDANNREVAYLVFSLSTLSPNVEIFINSNLSMEVIREFVFFTPTYTLRGSNWTVEGDLFQHNYKIVDGIKEVAYISKVWFSWGNSFSLDVKNDSNEILALSTLLALLSLLSIDSVSN